jgi:hypothetical protein
MSYDEELASRVREELANRALEVTERKMFGGICFMVGGGMCCGVLGQDLIVRVGPEGHENALALPHTRAFDFTGRPSRGMVYVGMEGTRGSAELIRWIDRGLSSKPADEKRSRRGRRPTK